MTWGECKLATLRTMFANEGTELTVDDSNQEYVNAMPEKANEALQQLCTVGRPILKQHIITVTDDEEATGTVYPTRDGMIKVDLKTVLSDFRAIHQLTVYDGEDFVDADNYRLEADRYLIIPGYAAEYEVTYAAYPQVITAETTDSTAIDIAPECCVLLPLYMASELYKEDELATATIWRNEFEDGLAKVQQAYTAQGGGIIASTRKNTTGWW